MSFEVGDWWLLDEERLIVYSFDADWAQTAELLDEPAMVAEALTWWQVATEHASVESLSATDGALVS